MSITALVAYGEKEKKFCDQLREQSRRRQIGERRPKSWIIIFLKLINVSWMEKASKRHPFEAWALMINWFASKKKKEKQRKKAQSN